MDKELKILEMLSKKLGVLSLAVSLPGVCWVLILSPETKQRLLDFVYDRPVLTCLCAGMWILACSLIVFMRSIGSRLNLGCRLEDWTSERIIIFFSRFKRKYLKRLQYRYRMTNTKIFKTRAATPTLLRQVYIELDIGRSLRASRITANPIRTRQPTHKTSTIWSILSECDEGAIVILAPSGSGKSTMMRHIVLSLASHKKKVPRRWRATIPLLIALRDHEETLTRDDSPNLAELMQHFCHNESPPPNWFSYQLGRGKCLVLFDGLDEVSDLDARRKCTAWIAKQEELYPSCRFVVTSRPHAYMEAALNNASLYEIEPLSSAQIATFVRKWFGVAVPASVGFSDPGTDEDASEQGSHLLLLIQNTIALRSLSTNPMVLTMMCMVHFFRGSLPVNRGDLYDEICDVLLGLKHEVDGVHYSLNHRQKRLVIEPLAFHMMKSGHKTIPHAEAINVISPFLDQVGLAAELREGFLSSIEATTGILVEAGRGIFAFGHLTFQEYLAAAYASKKGCIKFLLTKIGDVSWHECIRLYCSLTDASPIIDACMREGDASSMVLALECHALALTPGMAGSLEATLRDWLRSNNAEQHSVAAEAILKIRRRNDYFALSDTVEFAASNVSVCEYDLFLDDEAVFDTARAPFHWHGVRSQPYAALKPIEGVTYLAACKFGNWMTERAHQDGEVGCCYRLPTATEAVEMIRKEASGELPLSWVEDQAGFWTSDGKLWGLSEPEWREKFSRSWAAVFATLQDEYAAPREMEMAAETLGAIDDLRPGAILSGHLTFNGGRSPRHFRDQQFDFADPLTSARKQAETVILGYRLLHWLLQSTKLTHALRKLAPLRFRSNLPASGPGTDKEPCQKVEQSHLDSSLVILHVTSAQKSIKELLKRFVNRPTERILVSDSVIEHVQSFRFLLNYLKSTRVLVDFFGSTANQPEWIDCQCAAMEAKVSIPLGAIAMLCFRYLQIVKLLPVICEHEVDEYSGEFVVDLTNKFREMLGIAVLGTARTNFETASVEAWEGIRLVREWENILPPVS